MQAQINGKETEIVQKFFDCTPPHRRWTRLLTMLADYRADVAAPLEAEIVSLRAELAQARRETAR